MVCVLQEAGAHTLKKKLIRTTTRNWVVSYAQIAQLWANKRLQLDSFCFAGYQLGLCLELTQAKDDKDKTGPWFLGMRNTSENVCVCVCVCVCVVGGARYTRVTVLGMNKS
jgi:hypothetical protein